MSMAVQACCHVSISFDPFVFFFCCLFFPMVLEAKLESFSKWACHASTYVTIFTLLSLASDSPSCPSSLVVVLVSAHLVVCYSFQRGPRRLLLRPLGLCPSASKRLRRASFIASRPRGFNLLVRIFPFFLIWLLAFAFAILVTKMLRNEM